MMPATPARHAYVSMIFGNDHYVPGLEVLGQSLSDTGTTIPRVAMVTADISADARARLVAQGWQLHDVEPIANPATALLMPRFGNVFTKLRAWGLTDYTKVVVLDADTVVLQNIDELFERPSLSAAPDFLLPDHFNSGVMVLDPDRAALEDLLTQLPVLGSYDGGDQGFLNEVFDWYAMSPAHRLPAAYNTPQFIYQYISAHGILRDRLCDGIKVVHFTVQKPWLDADVAGGSALWWAIYDRIHPDQASGWRRRVHELEDWSFRRGVAMLAG